MRPGDDSDILRVKCARHVWALLNSRFSHRCAGPLSLSPSASVPHFVLPFFPLLPPPSARAHLMVVGAEVPTGVVRRRRRTSSSDKCERFENDCAPHVSVASVCLLVLSMLKFSFFAVPSAFWLDRLSSRLIEFSGDDRASVGGLRKPFTGSNWRWSRLEQLTRPTATTTGLSRLSIRAPPILFAR